MSAMDGGEWSASHPGRSVFVEIPPPPVPIENEAVWAPRVDLNPGTSCPQGGYYTDYTIPAPLCTKCDCILGCWREFYYTRCLLSEPGTVILVVCPFYINTRTNLTCEFFIAVSLTFSAVEKTPYGRFSIGKSEASEYGMKLFILFHQKI
jgi:hypothetical protein